MHDQQTPTEATRRATRGIVADAVRDQIEGRVYWSDPAKVDRKTEQALALRHADALIAQLEARERSRTRLFGVVNGKLLADPDQLDGQTDAEFEAALRTANTGVQTAEQMRAARARRQEALRSQLEQAAAEESARFEAQNAEARDRATLLAVQRIAAYDLEARAIELDLPLPARTALVLEVMKAHGPRWEKGPTFGEFDLRAGGGAGAWRSTFDVTAALLDAAHRQHVEVAPNHQR